MVVTGDQQHATHGGRSAMAHVLERIAAPVHAWGFAAPHREDAVVRAVADQLDLLRSPNCGGGQLLIDAGQKLDLSGIELLLRVPERFVDTADRGPAISRNKTSRVQTGGLVAPFLNQHQAHERLGAIQADAA